MFPCRWFIVFTIFLYSKSPPIPWPSQYWHEFSLLVNTDLVFWIHRFGRASTVSRHAISAIRGVLFLLRLLALFSLWSMILLITVSMRLQRLLYQWNQDEFYDSSNAMSLCVCGEWRYYPYQSGLIHWHRCNFDMFHWWQWGLNKSRRCGSRPMDLLGFNYFTTTKQGIPQPCIHAVWYNVPLCLVQILELTICTNVPGGRFTNDFSIAIKIRWIFRFTLISILIQWSLQNFVHGTTAVLSWHVQTFVAI